MNKNEEVNLKKLTNFIGKQKQRYKLCKLWESEISNLPLKHVRIVNKYFYNLHDCVKTNINNGKLSLIKYSEVVLVI